MQREEIRKIVLEVMKAKGLRDNPTKKPISNRIKRERSAPSALIVFHPGVRKLEQALDQVRQIEKIAARSGVFTVNSAREWVCGDDVREKAGSRCILDTVKPDGLEKALHKADILVLPTFCFKTAAKVAQLISDSQETAIVLSALMQGKPVLAANDGFTLLDNLSNKAIREEIIGILGRLESFGMVFCATDDLSEVFKKMTDRGDNAVHSENKNDSGQQSTSASRLITAKDVQNAVDNNQSSIPLAPGGIITPLARDQAREYAVRIIRKDP